MKKCAVSLSLLTLLCLTLAVAPASASTLYSNGPINGTINAYTINFGYAVTDSFTLTSGATVSNVDNIGLWLAPGDKPLTVDWSITSQPFGGTTYGSGTANFSSQFLYTNGYGYDIYSGMISFSGINLGAGTYYIELQNATTAQSGVLFWDENNGPSLAYQNCCGQIPSESFEITGGSNSGVPEPASLFMLGSGLLGLGGLARKRMKKA